MPGTGTACIDPATPALVVVGAGTAGVHFARSYLATGAALPLVLYGDEPRATYRRDRLTAHLAGHLPRDELLNGALPAPDDRFEARLGVGVAAISRVEHSVSDTDGRRQRYAKLVIATGAGPRVPDIPNLQVPGVYTLHNLEDADRLLARRVRARRIVVLGGGLLGLEIAAAMWRPGIELFVVEQNHWLLFRQLDQPGAELLREHLLGRGIQVILRDSVRRVLGDGRLDGLELRSGRRLTCDTLILATGARPNIDLAIKTGLAFVRGIRVNDGLATSDPDIYAIGGCAEHGGEVSEQAAPVIGQAEMLAARLSGGQYARRTPGRVTRTRLMGLAVTSIGESGARYEAEPGRQEYVYRSTDGRRYRKIRVSRDRLVGAAGVGDWPDADRFEQAVAERRRVWFWHAARFRRTGSLWA